VRSATRIVFFTVGIGFAVWAPLVPDAKSRLGLDEAVLSFLLLALGIGALVALPLAGRWVQAHGPRAVMLAGGALFCALMPALALAPSLPLLGAALALFGASTAAVDIAMNAQAVQVERATGRVLMSGFHGAYSVGALTGSLAMTLLLAAGLPPPWCAALLGAACAAALLGHAGGLLPSACDAAPRRLVWPRGRLALLGALCFAAFLLEGSVLDWSGVFIRFELGADPSRAGLGFGAMSLAMAFGRLAGDHVVRRLSAAAVLRTGAGLAASGFALAALVPSLPVFLGGCAPIGLGVANMVPILFSAAGRVPDLPEGMAIAAVATPGYAGLLAGPVLVGWAAQAISLPVAFAVLGILALAIGFATAPVRAPTR
jgi:MFS family permease